MRLLHTKNLTLEEFGDQDIPLYAILSHTWGKEEISLQDLETGNLESRQGFNKLKMTCCRAATDGFDYVWIDTCCIDKRSSAELSEAINSMYRWYQNATVCYAYLEDVYSDPEKNPEAMDNELRRSRWFRRGWTLQELIAPSVLIFFNQTWQKLGTKISMAVSISSFTHIPQLILLGGDLDQESVATRMSWASTRKTTRVEDLAYCLLGIFNINMPLLYGEGERAFIRLQEEIIKVSTDYSLFAWEVSWESAHGLLAPCPSAFYKSAGIVPIPASTNPGDAAIVDSEGVHVTLRVRPEDGSEVTYFALLPCKYDTCDIGIYIRRQVGGLFERQYQRILWGLPSQWDFVVKRICVQQPRGRRHEGRPLQKAAERGDTAVVNFLLKNESGLDPICVDTKTGWTPLSSAANNGHEAIVRTLLVHNTGASREYQSSRMLLPLQLALKEGHYEIIKMLLNRLDHLHGHNECYFTDLYSGLLFALETGHCGSFMVVTEHGGAIARSSCVTRVWVCETHALSYAIQSGGADVVELLLTYAYQSVSYYRSASYNTNQTTHKISMLEYLRAGRFQFPNCPDLGEKGHHDMLKVLLKYCPDMTKRGGLIPYKELDFAVQDNHEDVVKLPLRHGAGTEKAQLSPDSIEYAAGCGHGSILRLLVAESDHFKEFIVKNNVLVKAISGRKEDVIKLLLEEGVDRGYVDSIGETPLLWAVQLGNYYIVVSEV
ncbi:hypothetical protein LTR21_001854 [Exophiala xenobiotica]|nr:hypothetical protein LTR93_009897 [Exophiala xenobiotica]KAK5402558.1 hypothetical protein LTR79_001286 [Exophiala xenobiotica]KAK5520164.1 hypothetical protein LTR21_001854 [Exophiala xenobiotica]